MEHFSIALGLWIVTYSVIATIAFLLVASWALNTKAGEPGWTALIPFYNVYILDKIAGKPGWWLILWFLPIANFVVTILVFLAIAEKFGKSPVFAMGMVFLGFIFVPILAFGGAEYEV